MQNLKNVDIAKPNRHQDSQADSAFNVMFIITSMPIGGAEVLLVNMIRSMDPQICRPQVCCLKGKDVLGQELANEIPVHSDLINHKYDIGVVGRIKRLLIENQIDAVVTVGAGDKMFWGRLAAKRARVPVILSALHSTGWPDGVGRMNRILTPITDGFIAVAENHGKYLVEAEKFPANKVFVIPNGIDTVRFQANPTSRCHWRDQLGVPESAPAVGIVAALREEKNHNLFLDVAVQVTKALPETHFLVAGDGPLRSELTERAEQLGLSNSVHFLGSVSDVPSLLSAMDLFALTSDNEASPVSILEAMSCNLPVVATDVGSVSQSVLHEQTGLLVPTNDVEKTTQAWLQILNSPELGQEMGRKGRQHVMETSSLQKMTDAYVDLIRGLYQRKVLNRPETQELKTMSMQSFSATTNG